MKAVIITIGDELLIGQSIDTNAAWIGEALNYLGISVDRNITVRDDKDSIFNALDDAFATCDLILATGGLGPTDDDITKQTLSEYFDSELVLSEKVLEAVESFIKKRGFEVNERNKQQAYVPKICTVMQNPLGTAPVMRFVKNSVVLYSMPGVPFEMKEIMKQVVLPEIKRNFPLTPVYHKTIMTYGVPEAMLAEKLTKWESELPEYISLAYLPSPEAVKLRMSVYNTDQHPDFNKELKNAVKSLHAIIPDNIFSDKEVGLPEIISSLLREKNLTISTAESCTGGLLSSVLTSIAGASEIYKGSIVAYNYKMKKTLLNVNSMTLEKHGAVSSEVVEEMVKGLISKTDTDVGIAISGIAGPGGGTESKPVGTTWISVCVHNTIETHKFVFGSTRNINIKRAVYTSLHLLYKMLRDK